MSSAIVTSAGGVSSTLQSVRLRPASGPPPDHTVIRFPNMTGGTVQVGGKRYGSYTIQGWLQGTSISNVDTQFATLHSILGDLKGVKTDQIAITYDGDSTKTTITNVVLAGPVEVAEVGWQGSTYFRVVSFTLEKVS